MAQPTTLTDMLTLAETNPAAGIEAAWTMVRTLATRIAADKGEEIAPGQIVDAEFAGRWFTGLGLPPDGLGQALQELAGVYEDVTNGRTVPDTQVATDFVQGSWHVAATFQEDWNQNVVPSGRSPMASASPAGSSTPAA